MSHPAPHADRTFNLLAGVLAWLWPGLGHISIGQKRRGRLIMLGVLFLFVSGVLIGGIDSIDRRQDYLWFLAQSMCGPIAFFVDYLNQNWIKGMPAPQVYATVAINKPNEMGTLFTALAGLMNVVVILDALFFIPCPSSADQPAPPPPPQRRAGDGSTGD